MIWGVHMTMRGLIFSSIRVEPETLRCVLRGIERLEVVEGSVDCVFYDDNDLYESSALLREYIRGRSNWKVLPPINGLPVSTYDRNDKSRGWGPSTVDRVIVIKK